MAGWRAGFDSPEHKRAITSALEQRHALCPGCRFDLINQRRPDCPECGRAIVPGALLPYVAPTPRWKPTAVIAAAAAGAAALATLGMLLSRG